MRKFQVALCPFSTARGCGRMESRYYPPACLDLVCLYLMPLCSKFKLIRRGGYHPLRRTGSNCTPCLYKPSPVGGGGQPISTKSNIKRWRRRPKPALFYIYSALLFNRTCSFNFIFALRVGRSRGIEAVR